MDVACPRCDTEYEFDDALVSDRGTTVKCTNCGHQFKVHPPQSIGAPERWVVRTKEGRELVYTSLRDLQKGITQQQIGPKDMLSRGSGPPRPLGSIAELEPFFQHTPVPMPPHGPSGTAHGLGNSAPPPPAPPQIEARRPRSKPPPKPGSAPPPKRSKPPIPGRRVAEPGAITIPRDPGVINDDDDIEPPTRPRNPKPEPGLLTGPSSDLSEPSPRPSPVSVRDLPVTPPIDVVIREEPEVTPTPSDVQEGYRVAERDLDDIDPRFASMPPPERRSGPKWIVALVVVGGLVLLAMTVGREYLGESFGSKEETASRASDGRVASLLKEGNELLDEGDFEGAKEKYDKASALAEKDANVLVSQARLKAHRADIVWLKLRLLDPGDKDLVNTTHKELAARVRRALSAASEAEAAAPEDAKVIRARVDAYRLQGELEKARAHVAPIAKTATEPETAYVLAALDLAEKEPQWSSVIDRLRTAVNAERGPGRAHAALVYALARSGDSAAASSELSKIEEASTPHPLVNELRAFVRRLETSADAGADAAVATVDPSTLPVISETPSGDDERYVGGGDFRSLLSSAAKAAAKGNLSRAESLYRQVLAKDPGNTEALAGLGDVARKRNDPEAAAEAYDKVLEKNPSYIPALLGRADQKWAAGDKEGALALYRRVLEQAGPGTSYGQRAAARIAQAAKEKSGGGSGEQGGEDKPEDSGEEKKEDPAPEKKDDGNPHIDTSDLPPEFK